jgi:hypothetical protein
VKWIFFLGLSVFLCVAYDVGFEWNSDFIAIEAYYQDLVHGISFSGWVLPNCPSFFPDFLVYLTVRPWTQNINFCLLVFGTAITLGLFLYAERFKPLAPNGVFYVLVWLGLFLTLFSREYFMFLAPICHGGSFVMLLWCAYWYFSRAELRARMACGLMSGLLLWNDPLILVQFFVPLICVDFYFLFVHRSSISGRRDLVLRLRQVLAFVLPALATYFLTAILFKVWLGLTPVDSRGHPFFEMERMAQSLRAFGDHVIRFKFKLLVLAAAFWVGFGKARTRPIYAFMMVSIVSTLAFVLAGGFWSDSSNARYFYMLPMFVCLILAELFFERLWRVSKNWSGIVLVVIAVLASQRILRFFEAASNPLLNPPYPSEIACVDRQFQSSRIEVGYGEYWTAKRVPYLSRRKIRLLQVGTDFQIFAFNINLNWYLNLSPPTFFIRDVVRDQLKPEALLAKWGTPSTVIDCGQLQIWKYNRDLATINPAESNLTLFISSLVRFLCGPRFRPLDVAHGYALKQIEKTSAVAASGQGFKFPCRAECRRAGTLAVCAGQIRVAALQSNDAIRS